MDSANYQLTTCHMSMMYERNKNPKYSYELYFLCPSHEEKMQAAKVLKELLRNNRETSIVLFQEFTALKVGGNICLEELYMQNSSKMEASSIMIYLDKTSFAVIMQRPSKKFLDYLRIFMEDNNTHVKEVNGLGLFLTNKP